MIVGGGDATICRLCDLMIHYANLGLPHSRWQMQCPDTLYMAIALAQCSFGVFHQKEWMNDENLAMSLQLVSQCEKFGWGYGGNPQPTVNWCG